MDLSTRWYQTHTHQLIQNWCMHNFLDFILKSCWPPNSPDLCPLAYSLLTELINCNDWNQITTKTTLIDEIKRSVKRIEKEKILNSVSDFTVRLRMLKNNGEKYIRSIKYIALCRISSTIF